uniref:Kruppel-like factor 5b n=1 Tax=Cyprinus carpio TaxID=7962 RepID=A0A8C1Y0E1_CYPCA
MDGYLPPQFHMLSDHKKFCQDNSMTMDQGTPYSINMNVFLPDVTYLRTGMCRPMRSAAPQIKTEPLHSSFNYSSCHGSVAPTTTHPEYTNLYSPALEMGSSVYIKHETPSFEYPDVPLFQLLNSELEPSVPGGHSCTDSHNATCPPMPTYNSSHPQTSHIAERPHCNMSNNGYSLPAQFGQHPQKRAAYLPPSPPNSEPGSPDRRKELIQNLSPPPSYAASMASKMAGLTPGPALSGQTQAVPAQYNRRNNPDLDKRRIHHCDVPGCKKVYTKSSHLKAHLRTHTGKTFNKQYHINKRALHVIVCVEFLSHNISIKFNCYLFNKYTNQHNQNLSLPTDVICEMYLFVKHSNIKYYKFLFIIYEFF